MGNKKGCTVGVLGLLLIGFFFLNCAALRPKPIFVSKNVPKISEKPSASRKSHPTKSTQKTMAQKRGANETEKDKPKNRPLPVGNSESVSFRFRQRMMQAIDDYLGTPYKWGGEDSRGMDCSGFVKVVFARVAHLKLPHNVAQLARMGQPVSDKRLEFGDLLFFRKPGNGQLFHVGIYLGEGNFAHASTGNGVTISKLTENYYKVRFAFARRVLSERRKKMGEPSP